MSGLKQRGINWKEVEGRKMERNGLEVSFYHRKEEEEEHGD